MNKNILSPFTKDIVDKCKKHKKEYGILGTAFIQRKFKITYERALKIKNIVDL